jgi:hypothetical protein
MSADWYLISSPHYTEGTETNDFEFNANLGVDDFLTDTPLSSKIFLCKGKFNNDDKSFEFEYETEGILQGVSPETQTKGWQRQLLTRLRTISDYKYVKIYDEDYKRWNIWLIMTMPSNNKVYEKVVLYLCNYIAKWQDGDGNIIYQPFHVENASQYNTGEEGDKILTLGYNQLLVYTSLDDNTVYLNRTKRMFIDYNDINPLPYRITRIDTVSESYGENRVICLVFTEDVYDPDTDSIENWLCDYFKPKVSQPIEITYTGDPIIRVGGSAKTFTANTTETVTWELITVAEQNKYITMTVTDNKCKIKCSNNELLIGSSIKLKCTDTSGNIGELLIDIVGGV